MVVGSLCAGAGITRQRAGLSASRLLARLLVGAMIGKVSFLETMGAKNRNKKTPFKTLGQLIRAT